MQPSQTKIRCDDVVSLTRTPVDLPSAGAGGGWGLVVSIVEEENLVVGGAAVQQHVRHIFAVI